MRLLCKDILFYEAYLMSLESDCQAHIVTVSMMLTSPLPPPIPSTSTKGKVHVKAAPAPSKAKLAKKEHPTKKTTISSEGLSLHLIQTFPQEGKSNQHIMTVTIPDAMVAHIIRQGSKGLKQLHNISGTQISVYTLMLGPHNKCHVSIYSTDKQISDAFMVLGKQLALLSRTYVLLGFAGFLILWAIPGVH